MRDKLAAHDPLPAVAGGEIRGFLHTEAENPARSCQAAPVGGECIVGIDDRRSACAEGGHGLALPLRRALDTAETLEVFRPGIGDQADARLRERHQLRHIADAICADFNHRALVRIVQAHQCQRHADVVIQVALRREAGAHTRENCSNHLLHRGLAIAASNRDQRQPEICAPLRRQALQRRQRVRYLDLRQLDGQEPRDDRPRGTGLGRRRDETCPVEIRAAQRDEQSPRLQRAAIGRHRGVGAILALQPTADDRRRFLQHALHAASRRYRIAWLRSLNSRRVAP